LLASVDLEAAFHGSRVIPMPQVVTSRLGPAAGVIGAAASCMFRMFFEPPVASDSGTNS